MLLPLRFCTAMPKRFRGPRKSSGGYFHCLNHDPNSFAHHEDHPSTGLRADSGHEGFGKFVPNYVLFVLLSQSLRGLRKFSESRRPSDSELPRAKTQRRQVTGQDPSFRANARDLRKISPFGRNDNARPLRLGVFAGDLPVFGCDAAVWQCSPWADAIGVLEYGSTEQFN